MALPTVDYTAVRTLQEVLHDRLTAVQWEGRDYTPAAIGWHDVGRALDDALDALESHGYTVAKKAWKDGEE